MAVDYRKRLVALMRATVDDEAARHTWTYRAVRPMPVPATWKPGDAVRGDCSKGVQYLCRWAGAPDPMHEDYGAFGNSQTLWAHLQGLPSRADLLPGDIVTFGRDGGDHAAMVYEAGADPLLWSFGHQGAPQFYRLSADRRPAQYLRNPLPKYVPTAQDKLRAMTGYWSWVQWRLGEGHWAPYPAADKAVRPDVPAVIPPTWWVRYARYLAARNNANAPTPLPHDA